VGLRETAREARSLRLGTETAAKAVRRLVRHVRWSFPGETVTARPATAAKNLSQSSMGICDGSHS